MEFGVPLLVFSAVLAMTSEISILRQNRGQILSPWRYTEREPMPERINRGMVVAMAVMGALELKDVMGYWSVALIIAIMFAPLGLRIRHNRSVAAAS